jgi:hypothetical protein
MPKPISDMKLLEVFSAFTNFTGHKGVHLQRCSVGTDESQDTYYLCCNQYTQYEVSHTKRISREMMYGFLSGAIWQWRETLKSTDMKFGEETDDDNEDDLRRFIGTD